MISGKIIKVCGMREAENILSVEALGVDLMGFIFYPKSPRYVEKLPASMPSKCGRVGVFVNESRGFIARKIEEFGLDYVQLHGAESAEFCHSIKALGVKVIKAFSLDESFDFEAVEPYSEHCELFVFDTKCSGYGGSGEQFDWSLLNRYSGQTPFLLSGGITAESIEELKQFNHPRLAGYDLNSRFEISPAVKCVERLNNFLGKLK